VLNKNSTPRKMLNLLVCLWDHVSRRRRRQLALLVLLMVMVSFAEVVSLSALVPFLAALTSPQRLFEQPELQFLIQIFSISSAEELLGPVTLLFCFAILISGITRMILLWTTTRLSYELGADLSMSVYRRTLYQPYLTHISGNSSELVASMSTKVDGVILHIINPILIAVSSSVILVAILGLLILFDPWVSLIIFIGFVIIYLVIIKVFKSRLWLNSKKISLETTQVIKLVQESLGGIRDVLLDNTQEIYCQEYGRADDALRKAQASNYFIANSPRFIIEATGMLLIAVIALYLAKNNHNTGETIITLGVFGLGAQRLLPVLQQLYNSLTTIKGNQANLEDVLQLLEQPLINDSSSTSEKSSSFIFKHQITLSQASFRYSKELPYVINNIDLDIPKGKRIGFIGHTGSGKSTLIDLLIGLINPTEGALIIDGIHIDNHNSRQWQKHIAHVPQTIHLIDATISENIAFGERLSDIDLNRIKDAAKKAQIDQLIQSWELGYESLVGERGVRLSGGQRQRIAIARALYKQSDVIVFDEATSALDEVTEKSLMDAIALLNTSLTILIVAHRVSTLKQCDQIVELENGCIKRIGTYSEIIESQ
jgi:ABC-type multidrug transport system fused ATPase/permease subunit